jgi:DNA-binding NarL/FixJ family response regulator
MSRTTVLLADDHAIVAEGLASLLKNEFDLVGIATTGDALVSEARRLRPDVIVTDISMPGMNGLEAARRLAEDGVESKIVILTMHADPGIVAEAFRSGAVGFLMKHSAGDELIHAIREAIRGNSYLTPLVTRDVMTSLTAPRADEPEPTRTRAITRRQLDVLRLIARGKRMKEIAATLGLSTRTVESHKYDMMQALGIGSTAELIQYAVRHKLVTEDAPRTEVRESHP